MSKATDPSIASKVNTELVIDYVQRDIDVTRRTFEKQFDHQEQAGWHFVATVSD